MSQSLHYTYDHRMKIIIFSNRLLYILQIYTAYVQICSDIEYKIYVYMH